MTGEAVHTAHTHMTRLNKEAAVTQVNFQEQEFGDIIPDEIVHAILLHLPILDVVKWFEINKHYGKLAEDAGVRPV